MKDDNINRWVVIILIIIIALDIFALIIELTKQRLREEEQIAHDDEHQRTEEALQELRNEVAILKGNMMQCCGNCPYISS